MNQKYRAGRLSKNWNWFQYMDWPYNNWNNEEILLKMYRGEAAEYFVNELKIIKEIVEEIIDGNYI